MDPGAGMSEKRANRGCAWPKMGWKTALKAQVQQEVALTIYEPKEACK